jgi:hypothetical protein
MEPTTGIEPVNLFLTKEALYRLSYVGTIKNFTVTQFSTKTVWSGRRGSNSRHSAWKAEALPTELLPLDAQQLGRIYPLEYIRRIYPEPAG